jgi:cytochrome P450
MVMLSCVPTSNHPAHVPGELAFDFDMYQLPAEFADDTHRYWKEVQKSYPALFWTPHYGGHWVATRGEDIKHMLETYQEFSNRESFIPKGVTPRLIPPTLDPPEHTPVRALLQPAFTPKALQDVTKRAREVAIEIIEQLRPRGECEFVGDFAGNMPIVAFLTMLGLPVEDRPLLRGYVAMMTPSNSPTVAEGWRRITEYLKVWIEKRKAQPGDDLISRVVHGRIGDRPITAEETMQICQVLLGGGLDTVVTMTSFVARHLARHPEDRRALREEPQLIPLAVEEFARCFGTTNIGREVQSDFVYKGITLRKGDMVAVCTPLYGLDDSIYPNATNVDIRRKGAARHMAFGSGVHNCLGAVLARREIGIFLEEWLPRIPEFHIKPGTTPKVTTGLVNSMSEMWLAW